MKVLIEVEKDRTYGWYDVYVWRYLFGFIPWFDCLGSGCNSNKEKAVQEAIENAKKEIRAREEPKYKKKFSAQI